MENQIKPYKVITFVTVIILFTFAFVSCNEDYVIIIRNTRNEDITIGIYYLDGVNANNEYPDSYGTMVYSNEPILANTEKYFTVANYGNYRINCKVETSPQISGDKYAEVIGHVYCLVVFKETDRF